MIDLEPDNVAGAVRALAADGFRPRAPVAIEEFADAAIRQRWIEEKNLEVFSLWHPEMPGFEVDLFVTRPLDFDDAWERRAEVETERARIAVASLEDLVAMKRRAGRPRDLEDVAALRAIAESRERGGRGGVDPEGGSDRGR